MALKDKLAFKKEVMMSLAHEVVCKRGQLKKGSTFLFQASKPVLRKPLFTSSDTDSEKARY